MPHQRTTVLPTLERASLDTESRIVLLFEQSVSSMPETGDFQVNPSVELKGIRRDSQRRFSLIGGPFDRKQLYTLAVRGQEPVPLLPDGILNRCQTNAPLGLSWQGGTASLRLFAPRATVVELLVFEHPETDPLETLTMQEEPGVGCWSIATDLLKPGMLYGYRVEGDCIDPEAKGVVFADPYGWAITKRDAWPRPSLTVAHSPDLLSLPPAGHVALPARSLVIYEAHLRDATILSKTLHPSLRGSYPGAVEADTGHFLPHLEHLGINALEWLPLQDYDYHEPPYKPEGGKNGWNTSSRNHWGYMPGYYFAPEARYSTHGGHGKTAGWIGEDGRQILEMRAMVEELHRKGIAVILDVVYNHVAQYGENPLRQMDPHYALRHDGAGNRLSHSGCGNDLATERPMIRRLIVDSLKHWMTFYGIDGFRFDLAGLIDENTLEAIGNELRGLYPDIHLIAEPWGGVYDKERFARRNWASWNDLYRDALRGFEPVYSKTWLFGLGNPNILRHLKGDRFEDGGPFYEESQTVNYLACHDGYTLSDFIRIANGDVKQEDTFESVTEIPFSDRTLATMRLAFLLLLTSRGAAMIFQGDEFARTKWVNKKDPHDSHAGQLDRDSYNRDNATNWIDWSTVEDAEERKALVEYIRQLIRIRSTHAALTSGRRENLVALPSPVPRALGYRITIPGDDIIVLANPTPAQETVMPLPEGRWMVLACGDRADAERGVSGIITGRIAVPPRAGMILTRT